MSTMTNLTKPRPGLHGLSIAKPIVFFVVALLMFMGLLLVAFNGMSAARAAEGKILGEPDKQHPVRPQTIPRLDCQREWQAVPTGNSGTRDNYLQAVSMLSPND